MAISNTELSLTGSITRYELPYPISGLYRKYRSADSQSARYAFALLLGEGIFRFLAIVNVSNAIAEGASPKDAKRWLKMMNPPSMGKLLGLNRSTLDWIVEQNKQPFLTELVDFFQDEKWDEIQTIFPKERNNYAHRLMFLSEDAAVEQMQILKPILDQLLLGIQFLRRYHFGTFMNVPLRPRDGYYSAYWRASRGGEEDHEGVELRCKKQPLEGLPLLLDSTYGSMLSLFPLMQRTTANGIPQYVWFEDKQGAQSPKYIHPIYLTVAPQISLKHIDGKTIEWQEYLKSPRDWHFIEDLEVSEESVKSMSSEFPSDFEGQYEFIGLLGKGGMGEVYEVKNSLGLSRALKILNRQYIRDKTQWKRMKRAAETLAKLQHPSIVDVYTMSETPDGAPFVEMGLIRGDSLSEQLKLHTKLSLSSSIHLIQKLLSVLAYIHDADVWHRDIKPSNIMISETGQLYLIDFGIAKDNQKHNLTATHTSSRMGSEYWMAPEQFEGEASAQSDIYAAGLVLSALLGSAPKMPTRAPEFPTDAPDALREIYEKATDDDAKKRYQKAGEMLEAIERFISTLETPVTEDSPSEFSTVKPKDEAVPPIVDSQEAETGGRGPRRIGLFAGCIALLTIVVLFYIKLPKQPPKLTSNLKVQVFPANTNRAISDRVTEDIMNALDKMYNGGNTKYKLIVTKGSSDWEGRNQYENYERTNFLYNSTKPSTVQKMSKDFAMGLVGFCDDPQVVRSTVAARLTKLKDNDLYIFVGDDHQKILDCFQ